MTLPVTIPQSTNFRCFQTDKFKFDENGGKFSNRVENTVERGDIVHDEQFLLFPQCFRKTCTVDT